MQSISVRKPNWHGSKSTRKCFHTARSNNKMLWRLIQSIQYALSFIIHTAKYNASDLYLVIVIKLKDMHIHSQSNHILICTAILRFVTFGFCFGPFYSLHMTYMFSNTYISFLHLSLDVCFRGFLVLMLLTVTTSRLIQIRVTKIDDSWNKICHTIRIALQCTMQERCTTWQVVHCKWDSKALGYALILMHRVIILKHTIV